MKDTKMIAITGGIGSGKSTATNILKELGYVVFSSDEIVSELYKTRKVAKILKSLFPTAVKGLFLKIDRKALSNIVFNDKEKLALLTNTITPLVLEEILKRKEKTKGLCFAEVPLLFECNYQDKFDGVLVIYRPLKDRIESVKTRSNLTEQEILSRISAQFDYENSDLKSYAVITNDTSVIDLKNKLVDYLKTL